MDTNLQLGKHIADYLTGDIELTELESFLAGIAWELDDASPMVRRVAFDSLRVASEGANDDWTERQLHEQFSALLAILSHSIFVKSEGTVETQLLGKLSAAEKAHSPAPEDEESMLAALMGYAYLVSPAAPEAFGSAPPNARGFLHQPEAESGTPHQAAGEPAIG